MIKHINKTTGDGAATNTANSTTSSGSFLSGFGQSTDVYSFKTLWQEITNGLTSISNSVVNSITAREVTNRLNQTLYSERTQQTRDKMLSFRSKGNTGFYIFVIIIAIGIGFLAYQTTKK